MEARLGCSSTLLEPDKLDQFLKYDRKVLRFYMAWDDRRSLYGELRPFVLHYYLADDSMEVLEVRRANAGRDPFPLFLKRGKLYKDINSYLNIDAPTTHAGLVLKNTPRPSMTTAPHPRPRPAYSRELRSRPSTPTSAAWNAYGPPGSRLSSSTGHAYDCRLTCHLWVTGTRHSSSTGRAASTPPRWRRSRRPTSQWGARCR